MIEIKGYGEHRPRRLTYRYRVHRGATTTAWIGFTAKIRDAVTALEAFFDDVQTGVFPSEDETYHMSEASAEILEEMSNRSQDILADEAMGDGR